MFNSNKPLTNLIYEQIYRDVIDGHFHSGSILTESQLIQRYGVSKSPVREALISLCDENVLQSIPRTGYRVVQFTPDEVRQIGETRQALELFMFDKAWPALGESELEQLKECNHEMRKAETPELPGAARWETNVRFHLLLASFANNQYMLRLLKDTLRVNSRAATQYFLNINSPELEYKKYTHERLLEACVQRDYGTARAALIEDTNQFFWWEGNHR